MASESNAPNKDRDNKVGWEEDTQHTKHLGYGIFVHHLWLFMGNRMGALVAAQNTARYTVLLLISSDMSGVKIHVIW